MVYGRVQRKLAAILAADVVGYSRLMGANEEATLTALKDSREVIDPLIKGHAGRVFGSAGDSLIAEFSSPVEALRCATEIQLAIYEHSAGVPDNQRMRFRIGINLGDVMIDGDNLMGDAVNVAARLEALAPPGGICVSDAVLAQVRDKVDLDFVDLGEHRVKNIARPVLAFRVPLASEVRTTSPYRGLDTFEFEHSEFFYGRSSAITSTKERLERQAEYGKAFLLIYGMSGTGKSSLMRAGLLPTLVNSDHDEGIALRRYCLFRPSEGSSPTAALINRLQSESVFPEWTNGNDSKKPTKTIEESPQHVVDMVRNALAAASNSKNINPQMSRLIVAVDQLEELFTSEEIDSESRIAFVEVLSTLAQSGQVWVVCTIRADFYHRCGEVPGFSELRDGLGSFELLPPTGPEIAQMIREPARAAGMKFEEDLKIGNLADVLQQAAAREPGSLPLLQFVLDTLYEAGKDRHQMTFATYRALGGFEGAIARRADEVTTGLSQDAQAALPSIISALTRVREQDNAATSHAVSRREISATPGQELLVGALLDARLLTSTQGSEGIPIIRLAHDALLSMWPRARDIVLANREFLESRSQVRTDTRRWLAKDRGADFLLPSGKRLAVAEDLLVNRRGEIDGETIEFIEASVLDHHIRLDEESAIERRHQEESIERNKREAESAKRLAKRSRIAAAIILVFAIIAGAGAFTGLRGQSEAERQAALADKNASQARAAENEAKLSAKAALFARDRALLNQSIYLTDVSQRETDSGNATNGILLAIEALPKDMSMPNRPYVADAEVALYDAISAHREISVLSGHDGAVLHVAFSPDGRQLVSTSSDGTARIWDVESAKQIGVLKGHSGTVRSAAFSSDGQLIITRSADNTERLWGAEDRKQRSVLGDQDQKVQLAQFSYDGRRISTAVNGGVELLWDAESVTEIGSLSGHEGKINAISMSRDGQYVAASADKMVRLWEVSSRTEIAVLKGHEGSVRGVVFGPYGRILLSVSDDSTARLWNVKSGKNISIFKGHELGLSAGAISPDGSRVVTASFDNTARLWDIRSGSIIKIMSGHERSISAVAYTADGNYLVTGSSDRTARVWDASNGALLTILQGHKGAIHHVATSPKADRIATASADGTIRIWRVGQTHLLRHTGGSGANYVTSAVFSPSGKLALTKSFDRTARVWDVRNRAEVAVMSGHESPVISAVFSPDERYVLTMVSEGIARLWEIRTGEQVASFSRNVANPADGWDGAFLNVASFKP
ncbi:MAG: WD40 repeat protein/class 3 adenylate cyclase, partial [Woeseiaceae bacterium]